MSGFQQVTNPQNMPMRPLAGGMILDQPSQYLHPSQCINAKNYIITKNGPKRRPGYEPYGGTELAYEEAITADYRHIDLFTLWTSETGSADQELLLITAGPLYRVGIGGLLEVDWSHDAGTITVSGEDVTGAGTSFDTWDIYPGDILRCGGGEGRIAEVIDNGHLELEAASTVPDVAGAAYSIQHSFNTDDRYLCDWVVWNGTSGADVSGGDVGAEVIFADYNKPLVVYKYGEADGSQMELYIQENEHKIDVGNGPEDFVPRCVAVFKDRLFVGNLIEATDGMKRQRIRWSTATNPRDFSTSTNYIDLPYTQGDIVRLVPLGNMLIVYMTDAVYVGTPTNNPNLPVTFQRAETGSIGLVGMKAVTSYLDGHFFVGQDDIYLMSGRGPERIGSPVTKRTIEECDYTERIYAAHDPENSRIVFGFTKGRPLVTEIWSYQYKSKGWSYSDIETYMVANPLASLELSWADLSGFTWSEANPLGERYTSWDSMALNESYRKLFIERHGAIWQLSDNGAQDRYIFGQTGIESENIESVYETGDFDFDQPDKVKTFLRLSMKVDFDSAPTEDVQFSVQGSWNRGRSWKNLGTMRIRARYDEGYVNFLLTSSHARFRITCTSATRPHTISEIVVKVRLRGEETRLGVQAP